MKFRTIRLPNPTIPDHTCPTLDHIIRSVNEVRKANGLLRDAADAYEEAAKEAIEYAQELKAHIDTLEDEIGDLKIEAREAAKHHAALEGRIYELETELENLRSTPAPKEPTQ